MTIRIVVFFVALLWHAPLYAQEYVQGIYWSQPPTYSLHENGERSVRNLRAIGVRRVHLFLNNNFGSAEHPPTCASVFQYDYWTEDQVRRFARVLIEADFEVILTIAPIVATERYLHSLEQPFALARELGNVEIEYDLEGNWTRRYTAPERCADQLEFGQVAEQRLMELTRRRVPRAMVGVTVNQPYLRAHWTAISLADWVATQGYGNIECAPRQGRIVFDKLIALFREHNAQPRRIYPTISVHRKVCPVAEAIAEADLIRAENTAVVPGFLVWNWRELKRNPDAARMFGLPESAWYSAN